MGVNIKLHSKILALLNIELFNTILTKDTEKTLSRILPRNLNYIILRHPVISRTC